MNISRGYIVVLTSSVIVDSELVGMLNDHGYNAMSSQDFRSTSIADELPDCIIIENDHENDCFNMCTCIKDDFRLADIPVIIIRSGYSSDDIVRAFEAGAVDYIARPYTVKELLARLNNHITMQNMKERLEELVLERTFELTNTNRTLQYTIDEHKKILKDLQENETLLLTIALHIPNSYLAIIENNYTIGFATGQEFKKNGIDSWKLLGISLEKLYKEKFLEIKGYLERTFDGHDTSFELIMNGQFQYYRTVPLPNTNGEIHRILVVAENITERKESENKIRESLLEKETLLREIHHRVKNNLQLVSSMLNIQAHNAGSPELSDILKGIQARIFSMALVHEKMYHYKNFARINFREYLIDLAGEIKTLFSDLRHSGKIVVNMDIDDESLTIGKAIPCGLIMNELIINAYKHAFKGNGSGNINISFRKKEDGSFSMSVKDNGSGLPDSFCLAKTDSMGMVIIRELVNQLNGKVEISNVSGTSVEVVFGNDLNSSAHFSQISGVGYGKRILIVEDERIISKMLKRIIEDAGYGLVECLSSGREAIIYAIEKKPDLVLMDILLDDDIDGIQAARTITAEYKCPIIFLTGNSDPHTINSAWGVRPYHILTKPVHKYQLVEIIHSALHLH